MSLKYEPAIRLNDLVGPVTRVRKKKKSQVAWLYTRVLTTPFGVTTALRRRRTPSPAPIMSP